VAAACTAICVELDAALSPIIGLRGVAALFWRSLHLARATYPWLPAIPPGNPFNFDPGPLRAVLAQRRADEAAAAADCFLQSLHRLLVSLIGASLTERLLRATWGPPIDPRLSATAQDPPP
jgi:hypothetical protein